MKLEEIIKLENLRQEKSQHRTVHLLKEGNFYHAHDWSAWLMVKFPMCEKPLNVTAKRLKDGYIEAFVGFPCSSIEKYIPNDGSVEFKPASDTMIDVVLLNAEIGEATEEYIRRQVDEWKESLPLQEGKKQRREDHTKPWKVIRSVNSYLGILCHTASYRLKRRLLMTRDFLRWGAYNEDMTKFKDRKQIYK